ncbi:MAG: response regulator [Myxococcales bacterium]|nr:response regulator [Myxococcales bacterium]
MARLDGAATVLAGGGEMGALMRAVDWSRTPVGAVETWPQSLRTALSILLSTGFPMYIAWGPDFTQFYNDAYRPILGSTKHPRAMGNGTRETFAEIWDIIGPMFADVMAGTAVNVTDFLLPLDRHGFAEECYFIFSYSPIREESGAVGGVLVTVTETTERVLGARRLGLLQELAVRTQNVPTTLAACAVAAEVLASDPADLPFALLYLCEGPQGGARLSGASADVGALAEPSAWPLEEVCTTGEPRIVDCVAPATTSSGGPGSARALVLPIFTPGSKRPSGALVAGLSPRLVFESKYRAFLELVAGHLGAAIAAAQELEIAKARAEALAEIDRAKTAFFGNISHEFRTPLTLMLGPMEDARARGSLSGEDLDIAYRNGLRLQKLVNALLDFSRIEAGRTQATFVPTDLARFTAEIAAMFDSTMARAGLRFEVRCGPLDGPVYVDPALYEKVVLNLLSNAVKFTFEGSVEVSLADAGDHLELCVRDTGVGIPERHIGRVFERFYRIEGTPARTEEGSGIGLAFVSELVKMHGGTVSVASAPGKGSVFTVSLLKGCSHLPPDRIGTVSNAVMGASSVAFVEEAMQWLRNDTAPREETSSPPKQEGSTTHDAEARVLVADDNADMRGYLRRVLSEHVQVECVSDGRVALESARRDRPDLVLTDIMMPNLDGIGLLRAIREDAELRATPVLVLSARAGEEARVEGLEAGADDYLSKPFSARELVARVKTHLELARLRKRSESQLSELELLFEQAPAVICVLRGPDHVFRLANPSYLETIGNRDLLGKPIREALPELQGQSILETLDRVYETGERFVGTEVEIKLRRGPDLETTFWNFVYQPYHDPKGRVEGVMVFAFELTAQVTARRRAEELTSQLQESEARAAAANRAKDEFFAVLGHELRNPLAPILTALQMIRLRGDQPTKEQLVIERQTYHMVRLVDDLLDVSRIAHGKIELNKQRIELAEVVARGLEIATPLFEQRQHELELSVPRTGLTILGDSHRLAQVISNLLTNAAKYTDRGGHVSVRAAREGDEVVLRVRDDGVGIAEDVLPHVFDMFVQERQALDRSRGGLGLGLTISRSLVELHGGRIAAASAGRGRGSEFIVSLPAAEGSRLPVATEPRVGLAEHPAQSPCRVLVVDDNTDIASMIGEALEHLGLAVRVAHDGPQALRIAATFDPHVALVDIGLPVMDGYELAHQLRARQEAQGGADRVRLVAVTGYGQESDRQRSREAGFDAHLVKPVGLDRIAAIIRELGPSA